MLGFVNGNVRPRDESGNNDVHYIHLDLASLQSVREFAGEVWTLMSIIGPWMLPISILCLDFIVVFNFIACKRPKKGSRDLWLVKVRAKYPLIHTLVCNAGVWVPMDKQVKTEDGFEVTWYLCICPDAYLCDHTILLFAHQSHWIHFVKKYFNVSRLSLLPLYERISDTSKSSDLFTSWLSV